MRAPRIRMKPDGDGIDAEARPPDERANAGLWILVLTATAVNLDFWHAANDWTGAENYAGLAWLLFGLPLLFVPVVVATPWLVSWIRRGIGTSTPRHEARIAIAIPVVAVAAMIAIAVRHD